MRASYKNTSIALLVTLALSLFFAYAMRPKEAAGSGVNQLSPEWKNSSSAKVTLGQPEEIEVGNIAVAPPPPARAISTLSESLADDEFKITLSSATSGTTRTSVITVLTGKPNTLHRIEYY